MHAFLSEACELFVCLGLTFSIFSSGQSLIATPYVLLQAGKSIYPDGQTWILQRLNKGQYTDADKPV